jgi:hypothetical protein
MTDLVQSALDHTTMAIEMFEKTGHDEIQPILHLKKEGERDIIGLLTGVPHGMLYEAIQSVLRQCPYEPDTIVVISDAYYMFDPDDEYIKSIKNRTNQPLEVMFKLGDLRVMEACNVSLICKEGSVTVVQSYKWTPVDGWEWGKQEVLDSRKSDNTPDWEFERLVSGLPRRDISEYLEG